jgi:hypothetical protein
MALPNDISKIGQIANAVYNSVTANNTAVTALSINNNSVYPSTSGFRRNRIINGGMQIDQRNAGASQAVPTGGAYLVDRWFVQPTGASVTSQRVAGPSGYQYASQITGAASVTGIILFQKMEAANTADLVNQNVTLSVTIANSLLTTVSWTAYSANAVDNFSAVTVIASGSFTVTSTATQYTATFNAGANAANGMSILFSVGAQTSGTWSVTGVQLEAGSLATPFERLPIGETLMLCQRYYVRTMGHMQNPATGGGGMIIGVYFPVEMRVTPSATFISQGSSVGAFTVAISPRNTKTAYFQMYGTIAAADYVIDYLTGYSAEL